MKVILLFSGQGSQRVGMGAELAAACDACRGIFEAADQALGFPLSRLMTEGPMEALRQTEITQPAVLTLAVAHAHHLWQLGVWPDILVGHSLGQYAALVVAGALEFGHAVRLVAERGRLMQRAVPDGVGAMMAIVALERQLVYQACEAARPRGVVSVACHNSPGQTVISGACAAVEAAAERCEDEGGGVVPLPVSIPAHCELLSPMVSPFAELVANAPITQPALPVIDNVTARALGDATAVRLSLVAQLTAPVLFEESVRYLSGNGGNHFIQCGPGRSLLSFSKRIAPEGNFETFEEAATRIASA